MSMRSTRCGLAIGLLAAASLLAGLSCDQDPARVVLRPDAPPARVDIVQFGPGAEPGDVFVEFTAVGEHEMRGRASAYHVRTSPQPILDDDAWAAATEHSPVSDPVPAGEHMAMTITGLGPALLTHISVRAADAAGQLSPLSESPGVLARGMRFGGRIRDAVSLDPVPGASIRLGAFTTTSDAAGMFELCDLPPTLDTLWVTDESVAGEVGEFFDYRVPYEVEHGDVLDLYLLPNIDLVTTRYGDLHMLYQALTAIPGIPPSRQQRRWELPIDLYVPPFSSNGLDYRATIIEVTEEFNAILEQPLFRIVDEVPVPGETVEFVPDLYADNHQFIEWTPDYYPNRGRVEFRTKYSPSSLEPFRRVIRHELGHALGLYHSVDRVHLMVGGYVVQVSWFSADELAVIQALYHIPRGHDMRNHLRE